uniref:TlpA family protein disulfide reductase n=1 Tax=Flavobacterium sp. TaxID=239 RepID=UPI00375384E8
RELSKEEIKDRKTEYKIKLKEEKKFRNKLEGTIIDELNLEDINGLKFNLENLKGKVIVLNFWFTQCAPCVAEFPELNQLKQKYKSQPVVFFAITWNNIETINKFLLNHKLDFTIIPNGKLVIDKFKIPHYPYNIVINKNGEIEYINDALVLNLSKKLENKIEEFLTD